jgi:serine/threonine protein phosphatase PrpC
VDHVWIGSEYPALDTTRVIPVGPFVLGLYGGDVTAGATVNEDAAYLWAEEDWEFVVVCDAHGGSDSAELVLKVVQIARPSLQAALACPVSVALPALARLVPDLFTPAAFRHACETLTGETSCLVAVRKGAYLWWMNIGDVRLYAFHPEYARLGQFAVMEPAYFEWIGRVSTFDEAVPCYATGVKRLRQGDNVVFVTTDGLLNAGDDTAGLFNGLWTSRDDLGRGVQDLITRVQAAQGRDSATLVAWRVCVAEVAPYPST